jgi:hypothetical protein
MLLRIELRLSLFHFNDFIAQDARKSMRMRAPVNSLLKNVRELSVLACFR